MLQKLKGTEFDLIYRLMEKSFPKEEYRDYEKQKELFENPEYQIWVEKEPDFPGIKAFIAIWEFEKFVYVEHFAVDPAMRNGGIGSAVLRGFAESTKKRIILEVEPPEEEMAVRRIAFYERNGFWFNDYPYIQPSMGEGRKATPLFIMTTGGKIEQKEYEKIRDILYTKVYKVQDPMTLILHCAADKG